MPQEPASVYSSLGWRLQPGEQPVHVNALVAENVAVAAIRSYDACSHHSIFDEQSVRVVLVQSGNLDGSHEGSPFSLSHGTVTLMRGTDDAGAIATSPSSRLAMQVPASYFTSRRFGEVWGDPRPVDTEQLNAFFRFAHTFMNSSRVFDPHTANDFSAATALLLRAMLSSSIMGRDSASVAHKQDRALRMMHEVIGINFRDPGFSVAQLARHLFMSESSLRRLCSNVHTTPLAEIRQRRINEALTLSAGQGWISPENADMIALSAGFTSRVMMQRQLLKARSVTPGPKTPWAPQSR